jgi:hypothetical protein
MLDALQRPVPKKQRNKETEKKINAERERKRDTQRRDV